MQKKMKKLKNVNKSSSLGMELCCFRYYEEKCLIELPKFLKFLFLLGFFVFFNSNIYTTFKRKKNYNHQVILIDILPGKTKNGLKI